MADVITRLFKGAVPTSSTTLYTVGASPAAALVRFVSVVNTTGGVLAFDLSFAGTKVFSNRSLEAGEQLTWDGGHLLLATEVIVAQATASGLEIYITGVVS